MKLYRLENKLGSWYVLAEDPAKAENKLLNKLNGEMGGEGYGFSSDRIVTSITIIATEDKNFITNNFLIT